MEEVPQVTTAAVIAVLAVVCAVVAWILHRYSRHGRMHVPLWSATLLIGFMLGIVIGMGFADAFTGQQAERIFSSPPPGPRSLRLRHTLLPGDKIKLFESQGWLNASPPEVGGAVQQLYVLDIWTGWCPVCAEAAPGVVRTYEKFKDRGVQFVSISVLPEEKVCSFVDTYHVAWPAGYGATVEAMLDYGALDPGSSQALNPMVSALDDAYVVPTIYVLRGDGTVLWTDENSRYMHKPLDVIATDLEAALESALAGLGDSHPERETPGSELNAGAAPTLP